MGCAALYAAVGHELDTEPLRKQLSVRGVRTCYPRIVCERPPELAFHAVVDPAELAPARFGLYEPQATATPVLPTEIDVFIVPGLAFDLAGATTGPGRGYYDACLPGLNLTHCASESAIPGSKFPRSPASRTTSGWICSPRRWPVLRPAAGPGIACSV